MTNIKLPSPRSFPPDPDYINLATTPTPLTTQYDILIGGVGGVPTRLPIGSNGQLLGVDSGGNLVYLNSSAGMANPMTLMGDTIYGGTSGVPTKLTVGVAGQILTVYNGLPSWQNPPNGLPNYSSANNGEVLGVSSGAPGWVTQVTLPVVFSDLGTSGQVLGISSGNLAWINQASVPGVFTSLGSDGQILGITSGNMAWVTPSGSGGSGSGGTSIPYSGFQGATATFSGTTMTLTGLPTYGHFAITDAYGNPVVVNYSTTGSIDTITLVSLASGTIGELGSVYNLPDDSAAIAVGTSTTNIYSNVGSGFLYSSGEGYLEWGGFISLPDYSGQPDGQVLGIASGLPSWQPQNSLVTNVASVDGATINLGSWSASFNTFGGPTSFNITGAIYADATAVSSNESVGFSIYIDGNDLADLFTASATDSITPQSMSEIVTSPLLIAGSHTLSILAYNSDSMFIGSDDSNGAFFTVTCTEITTRELPTVSSNTEGYILSISDGQPSWNQRQPPMWTQLVMNSGEWVSPTVTIGTSPALNTTDTGMQSRFLDFEVTSLGSGISAVGFLAPGIGGGNTPTPMSTFLTLIPVPISNVCNPGIYLFDTTDSKYIEFCIDVTGSSPAAKVKTWTAAEAGGSGGPTTLFTKNLGCWLPTPLTLSIYDDGTSWNFRLSVNGFQGQYGLTETPGQFFTTLYSYTYSSGSPFMSSTNYSGFGMSFTGADTGRFQVLDFGFSGSQ